MRQSLRSKKNSNYSNIRFNSVDKLFNVLYKYSNFKLNNDNSNTIIQNNLYTNNYYGKYDISIGNRGNGRYYSNNIINISSYKNINQISQKDNSIFIGFHNFTDSSYSTVNDIETINIGQLVGQLPAKFQSINIGYDCGYPSASNSISIGSAIFALETGIPTDGLNCIFFGDDINTKHRASSNCILIGRNIGRNGSNLLNGVFIKQQENTIGVGVDIVHNYQGKNSIAIGSSCCSNFQHDNSIAIGTNAGKLGQEKGSIFIGNDCGHKANYMENNSSNSYMLGDGAGSWGYKKKCIQIGKSELRTQKENTISINIPSTSINPTKYFPENIIYIGKNSLGDTTTTGPNTLQFNTTGLGFVPMSHTLSSPGFFVNSDIGSSNIGLPASSNNCVFYDTENYELFVSTNV